MRASIKRLTHTTSKNGNSRASGARWTAGAKDALSTLADSWERQLAANRELIIQIEKKLGIKPMSSSPKSASRV